MAAFSLILFTSLYKRLLEQLVTYKYINDCFVQFNCSDVNLIAEKFESKN